MWYTLHEGVSGLQAPAPSKKRGENSMFKRLKRIWRVAFRRAPGGVQGDYGTLPALSESVEVIIRELADVHTAIQRIERKQLRWIELFNLKNEMKEPPGNRATVGLDEMKEKVAEKSAAFAAPGAATGLTPGQIVD